jgi:hypothetical protein
MSADRDGGGPLPVTPPPVPAENGTDPGDWVRLPAPGCRLAGLSRTTWAELLASGKVQGATLRKPNAARGIRLIFWPSAQRYFSSLLG